MRFFRFVAFHVVLSHKTPPWDNWHYVIFARHHFALHIMIPMHTCVRTLEDLVHTIVNGTYRTISYPDYGNYRRELDFYSPSVLFSFIVVGIRKLETPTLWLAPSVSLTIRDRDVHLTIPCEMPVKNVLPTPSLRNVFTLLLMAQIAQMGEWKTCNQPEAEGSIYSPSV